MTFTQEQMERYSRHIILKNVGAAGQKKLLAAKVLVIGAGGLGSPVLMYLAASGVGTIGIADDDAVDLSNLQRQIIHSTDAVGEPKAESAARRMHEINPDVKTIVYKERVTAENIADMIRGYDFIIDGVDNFAAKFLINDACVLAGKPFCHGGIREFTGQVMTYVPGQGPCYRCIFEEIPPAGATASCKDAGVLGTLPGIIGSIQAFEAQKYILGVGELLTGCMLVFDGLTMKFRTVEFDGASPHCRVCGEHADIHTLDPDNYIEQNACSLNTEGDTGAESDEPDKKCQDTADRKLESDQEKEMQRSIVKKFRKEIWRKFTKAINDYDLMEDGDKIAVFLDDRPESLLAVKLLEEIRRHGQKAFDLIVLKKDLSVEELKARGCTKVVVPDDFEDVIGTILRGMLYEGQVYTKMPKFTRDDCPDVTFIRPLCLIERDDMRRWFEYNHLSYVEKNEKQTKEDQEIAELIRTFRARSPYIEKNIFKSVENVSLSTIIGYTKDGENHHFLDTYDETGAQDD